MTRQYADDSDQESTLSRLGQNGPFRQRTLGRAEVTMGTRGFAYQSSTTTSTPK